VPGHDLVRLIDQNRIVEAELLDRICDLRDLPLRMPTRIARIGPELPDRRDLDRR